MLSIEAKRAFVEEFKASNLSQKVFSEKKGVPLSTLQYWIRAFREEALFGKIDWSYGNNSIDSKEEPKEKSKGIMQFSCENIRIELKDGYNKEFLKSVIEVMNNAN